MITRLIIGDCLQSLQSIPSQSVNCCVTSPPYFGLRDYGVDGQIGTTRANGGAKTNGNFKASGDLETGLRNRRSVWTVTTKPFKEAHFATYPPDLIEPCIIAGCPAGGTVLDPFFGAGTTGLVAQQHGRNWIGCELNPEYAEIAKRRLGLDAITDCAQVETMDDGSGLKLDYLLNSLVLTI